MSLSKELREDAALLAAATAGSLVFLAVRFGLMDFFYGIGARAFMPEFPFHLMELYIKVTAIFCTIVAALTAGMALWPSQEPQKHKLSGTRLLRKAAGVLKRAFLKTAVITGTPSIACLLAYYSLEMFLAVMRKLWEPYMPGFMYRDWAIMGIFMITVGSFAVSIKWAVYYWPKKQ